MKRGLLATITRAQAQASTFVPVKQGTCTFATLRGTNNPGQRKLGTNTTEYRMRAIIRELKSGYAIDVKHTPSTHTPIIFNPSFELFDINLSPSPPTLELPRCSCCSSVAVLLATSPHKLELLALAAYTRRSPTPWTAPGPQVGFPSSTCLAPPPPSEA